MFCGIVNKFIVPAVRCIQTKVKIKNKHHIDKVYQALITELGDRQSLPADEWRKFHLMWAKQNVPSSNHIVLSAIKNLDESKDRLANARNCINALDMKQDIFAKRLLIELLALKAQENDLDKIEEQEIIELCNDFITNNMHYLPMISTTVTNGLCATNEWKKVLEFPQIKCKPMTMNIIIRKAMQEQDIDLVWSLIQSIVKTDANVLTTETLNAFWKFCAKNESFCRENISKMFQLFEKTEFIMNETVANGLRNLANQFHISCQTIQIDFSGECKSCKNTLDVATITPEELKLLQENFLKNVVRVNDNDIYQKTNPNEWNAFVKLIECKGPFDIVIDALNVLLAKHKYKNHSIPNAVRMTSAIENLVENGKRVLVIGRQPLENILDIKYLNSIASVFLTDNTSKDDVFLLYGAMKSGPSTQILSNDYMRDHKYLVGSEAGGIFKKWQQQNMFTFLFDSNDTLKMIQPMKFKMHCHQHAINGYWHLPFISDKERDIFNSYELPNNWICVQF